MISIIGQLLRCKKGSYFIPTLKEDVVKIFTELIDLSKDFCDKPDSSYLQMRINEKGVIISFTPKDYVSKDFNNEEKSIKVLEKYTQALEEIKKLD